MTMQASEISSLEKQIFKKAHKLFGNDEFRKAETMLEKAVEELPESGIIHGLLALCYAERGSYVPARAEAEAAVRYGPFVAFAHYSHARVLSSMKLHHEALIEIREAIHLQPEEVIYYAHMAAMQLEQDACTEAVATAGRGLQLDPGDPECRSIRRQALAMIEKEHGSQVERCDTLLRITMNASLSSDRGWEELNNRNYIVAFEHFNDALILEPEHKRAKEGMLVVLCHTRPFRGLLARFSLFLRRTRRIGLATCVLLLAAAGLHVVYADTFPYGLLWFFPGLIGLIPFLIASWVLGLTLHGNHRLK